MNKNKLSPVLPVVLFCCFVLGFCSISCRPKTAGNGIWYHRADSSSVALANCFWNYDRGYLNYDSAGDTTFHYWPQAHGLDVYTDWYVRTGDPQVLSLYDEWLKGVPAANGGGWWNQYYDDMEWNAIATLRAYEASGDSRFLEASKELWELIKPAWNERGGGGMTWKKGMEWSKNACSNGPAAIAAARLYAVLHREEDLQWAKDIYDWERRVLFDNGAIYDSINGDTGKISKFCLTYNQGTFIGAAVNLYKLTGNRSYIDDAILAADYTLEKLTVEGNVLQPEGARDGGIFKGIFVRYFTELILDGDLPQDIRNRYIAFLSHNAETLWQQGNNECRFAPDWRQKPETPSAMTPQLSGCMLIEAMALLEQNGLLPLHAFGPDEWDQQKWPDAEPYSANLSRDFTWKPGPSNLPVGTARGIFPGRVVMSRYPEAAHWSGRWDVEEDQWFLDSNTDKDKCEEMISVTLRKLTGARTDKKAWEKIFIHHNTEIRGLGKQGYTPGETVAIKINLNNSNAVKTNNQSDATPQMTLALVRHLVHKAGVPEDCIIIYEVRRQIYAELLNEIWQEFPDVRFVQDGPARSGQPENPKYGGSHGLEAADWVDGIEFTHDDLFNEAKLIAKQVKDATYLVNMAMLKLHSYPFNYMEHGDNGQTGITMSAKNHAGSIKGTPEIHKWINSTQIRKLQNVEHGYNPLVDLEASPNLGRKTILYLLDGLYCGRKWSTYPLHFPNAPFFNRTEPYENPDWPACLLASLDPVALQSVGLDILYSQSLNNTEPGYYNVPRIMLRDMADDILKEMATPFDSPSGTVYKQQGQPIPSLGVFEHWDGPATMKYSRNLDPKNGQGIELIYIPIGNARR